MGRFCDPPAFLKACANASSLRMFSKGRDDYGRHAKHDKRSSLQRASRSFANTRFCFCFLMVFLSFFKFFAPRPPRKWSSRRNSRWHRFLNNFGSIFQLFLERFRADLVPTWLHVGVILGVLGFCAALVATNMRLGVSWGCLGCVLRRLGGVLQTSGPRFWNVLRLFFDCFGACFELLW